MKLLKQEKMLLSLQMTTIDQFLKLKEKRLEKSLKQNHQKEKLTTKNVQISKYKKFINEIKDDEKNINDQIFKKYY